MGDKIVVSIIIPTYNREKTITRSILSITRQQEKNIEVLVIDDGSVDSTEQEVKKLVRNDRRIRYYKQENSGANKARNLGIKLARGEYIAFNDSDDVWREDKLKKELSILKSKKQYQGAFSKFKLHIQNKGKTRVFPTKISYPLFKHLLQENIVNTPNLIIKKEALRKIGGFDEDMKRFQDWELALRISKSFNLYFINEILVDTYQYGFGHISNNKEAGIEGFKKIEEAYYNDINSDNRTKIYFYLNMLIFSRGTSAFKSTLYRIPKLFRYNIMDLLLLNLLLLKKTIKHYIYQ